MNLRLVISWALICFLSREAAFAERVCEQLPIPSGAVALNYTKVAFDFCPSSSDISMDDKDPSRLLYNGVWWKISRPENGLYGDDAEGALTMSLGAVVATVPTSMALGRIPLLSGAKGFFVEFETSISDNDRDHWPAVWLMPVEHNRRQEDSYPPDDRGFERWVEIDVDEGGFSPGPMATVLYWTGKWPAYKFVRSDPNLKNSWIDRTQHHRFSAGFNPIDLTITFWHNDQVQYVAHPPAVDTIARKQNYYVIMNVQSRKEKTPYQMTIHHVRAFVPE